MIVRSMVAAAAALLIPLTGTSQASCLDDAQARNLQEGYARHPKSQYYEGSGYVEQSGPATVTLHGDALVSDYTLRVDDLSRYAPIVAGNVVDIAGDFVNCVAG